MQTIKFQTRAMLQASPRIILVAAILVFLVTNQALPLRFAGYYLFTELLVVGLKMLNGVIAKGKSGIYRPQGAGCTGCGTFAECSDKCIDVSGDVGMPSGHSAAIMMAATFWSIWIWGNVSGDRMSKIVRISTSYILALMVVISRTSWVENCHTIPQVIVGSVLGIALGAGFYILDLKYLENK